MKQKDKKRLYELKKKNPGLAATLDILVVGLGHFYLGEYAWGVGLFFLTAILWTVLLGWIVWFAAPIHAYKLAKKKNELLRIELGVD